MKILAALALACLAALPARAGEMREISGQLAYHEKMALPADAEMVVDLRAPDGTLAATLRRPTEGAQVPLPFRVMAPAGRDLTLRGALFLGGRPVWASGPVAVAAGSGALTLPPIALNRYQAMGFASRMDCGGKEVEIGFIDGIARLKADGKVYDLAPAKSASGARYQAADDAGTWFWGKGNSALVSIAGTELPECAPVLAPPLFPLVAHGNEPGWRLEVAAGEVRYTGNYGETTITGPLPAPEETADGLRFVMPGAGLSFTLNEGLCHDDMTGMPHPVAVTLDIGGTALKGCGGSPVSLIEGPAWTVTTIAGAAPDKGVTQTIAFAGGRVAGRGGCNRYTGAAVLTGEGLRLGPLAATRMACPAPQMAAEQQLFGALAKVDRFDIGADGALQLIAADKPVVTAKR